MPASEGGPDRRPSRNHRCGLRSRGLERCESPQGPGPELWDPLSFLRQFSSEQSLLPPPPFPEPAPRGMRGGLGFTVFP